MSVVAAATLPATSAPGAEPPRPVAAPTRTAAPTADAPAAGAGQQLITSYRRNGYRPRAVAFAALPYHDEGVSPRRPFGLVDSAGVRVYRARDGRIFQHPVAQAQYGLKLLYTYQVTNDPWFLDRAKRQARRLVAIHRSSRGAWWLPYRYVFPLAGNRADLMRPPWYSAMAQGQALSLFIRLAAVTGDASWRAAADVTFLSLTRPPAPTTAWVTWQDANRYLWLEEFPRYPVAQRERVLNGHLFALYGLYDYWRLTANAVAAALFDGAATTAAVYVPRWFRVPGGVSAYSLRTRTRSERYHHIHVNQLRHLHALTGVRTFAGLGEALHSDFPRPDVRRAVTFRAGRQVPFTRYGETMRPTRPVRFTRASAAMADQRRRVGSVVYYRMATGAFRGRWVRELTGHSIMVGVVGRFDHLGSRQARLRPGVHVGYRFDGAHRRAGSRSTRPGATVTYPVSALGWWRGLRCVLVSSGPLAGHWVPLSARATLA
ncbi:D-glucuronyl C5-epimerase family protein [Pilimelia columellifera]|uniref:D-glucuronyl C5-epimerase family protein n=1 Tax=Pilimelia columellifera TaxID=706574 RepID=UPI0031DECDAC